MFSSAVDQGCLDGPCSVATDFCARGCSGYLSVIVCDSFRLAAFQVYATSSSSSVRVEFVPPFHILFMPKGFISSNPLGWGGDRVYILDESHPFMGGGGATPGGGDWGGRGFEKDRGGGL